MELKQRINALTRLGNILGELSNDRAFHNLDLEFESILTKAQAENGWFTLENIKFALQNWSKTLTEENLTRWVSKYDFKSFSSENVKTVAIVMAGNVPLVGFHDFISVLITGNKVLTKLSSNDRVLLPFLSGKLIATEPDFENYIQFTEGKLKDFDAVIATGSDNTSRYFDFYFQKYPHIIRRNRNSVAVLTGNETEKELALLSDDIFRYFGLGCRNVSKLYVPQNYNFDKFFNAVYSWKEIINNHKYINNYDYNKAVYLMDSLPLLDNEFLLLKEDSAFSSPIAVVFYEKYNSDSDVLELLKEHSENLQCIVSNKPGINGIPFGKTQNPELWDYADGVDTVEFLLSLTRG
ncbi:acyl-CoA reductase [Aequorivita sp. H23M31]|uniref:long-chain-fatty-acyl-CoA reductase n=1 Tax=Aequorivita ciconiae TaxID=2494375 RepID=A0A410FZL3_9FLAO|nr:acyl-CoA reductase [Aequorivita sp. H23M31]QAA80423.1 acyl-CoA reductase [Aequorivita sp. H23M31]